ncbi:MAG TPA: family 10 glycosylhydrolase, partial [Nitriliruptorales bacterium]
ISAQVEAEVAALGVTTQRVAGSDRAETAALASAEAETGPEAFIVNGHRPADALVAGAVAARAGAALLLVDADGIPASTDGPLQGIQKATIVGGFSVVSAQVEEALRARIPDVTRLSGPDRSETAASVARTLRAESTVHVVSGADPSLVDAIAAGWLAARPGGGPVLYSDVHEPGRGTDRYLRLGGLAATPAIRLVGGDAILSAALVDELEVRLDEAEAGGPASQTRAIWVHLFDGSLKSREGIARVLDTAAEHNLNTVIAQVARRHDSYYTSDVLPRTPDPAMPADLDLLAELIPQARARGLEVQAWFAIAPVYRAGAYGQMPPGHVYNTHGPDSGESWMTYARVVRDGEETFEPSSEYMDVGVPGFRDHVVAMIEEVAQRYDVDAVHLDYARYPEGGNWGYNPQARAQWQAEGSPDFSDWRRAQTEKLAKAIKQAVTAARPGTHVTMAAIAQGDGPAGVGGFQNTRAFAQTYQDWAGWLAREAVDAAYPMAYMREDDHAIWYDHWVQFAAELAPHEDVAVGQASFLNTVGQSLAQLSEALTATDGVVLYSYQQDTKCPAGRTEGGSPCSPIEPQGSLLDALLDGPFADPAPARRAPAS